MDIAGLSMEIAKRNVSDQIGVAVFNLAKDTMEQAGENVVSLIDTSSLERSINPNLGVNIDIRL